ncbi:uncharacterized protein Z519_12395 [Cladophialophora bantiana CBS 173.52]|uniref:Uncharacterized protein n=1 Tax=Cladophialophora bantiana (strain ATCC 10958 / CBS 173.52 / CDC B-1940 / NIH 8579) TaxID=1442370 RepID=A0A0D2H7U5_CLAB1|nr:uncharacterized protein Z519_12395 [Cladophialophora bantiana CBS 173.52]KIW86930.1 hypothetical protein Z519_12395 [Cladophialophora bantiana CBS 173.52]
MSGLPESSSRSSLPSDLNFELMNFDRRKRDARDIVSSFDLHTLPSEFDPDSYQRITVEQSTRPSFEWTVAGDLWATFMRWIVHDPICWDFANRCQPTETRAQLFAEKLRRRFQQEFDRYDELPHHTAPGLEVQPSSPAHASFIVAQVAEIANKIHSLVAAALTDLQDRAVGRGGTVKVLLGALEAICRRCENISPVSPERDQSPSGTEVRISLYDVLVGQPPPATPNMILQALERASEMSPGILSKMKTEFETIGRVLPANTPLTYLQQFQNLSAQAGATM